MKCIGHLYYNMISDYAMFVSTIRVCVFSFLSSVCSAETGGDSLLAGLQKILHANWIFGQREDFQVTATSPRCLLPLQTRASN